MDTGVFDPSHGLITRQEVLAAGFDDAYIARMVRCGAWSRVRSGALMVRESWEAMSELEQHRVRARAVLGKARCEGVLSHVSALAECGVPFWDLPLADVHLTRFDERGGRRAAGVCQHRGRLFVTDVTMCNGVLVTSPARTALDILSWVDSERGFVVACGLVRAGQCSVAQLEHAYASVDPRAHSLATRVVLSAIDARLESVGEMRTYFQCRRQGLPTPVPQYEIWERGRLVA